jgi:hypothetical protein
MEVLNGVVLLRLWTSRPLMARDGSRFVLDALNVRGVVHINNLSGDEVNYTANHDSVTRNVPISRPTERKSTDVGRANSNRLLIYPGMVHPACSRTSADRTKPCMCSAARLVAFSTPYECNCGQCSPSGARPHLLGKDGTRFPHKSHAGAPAAVSKRYLEDFDEQDGTRRKCAAFQKIQSD